MQSPAISRRNVLYDLFLSKLKSDWSRSARPRETHQSSSGASRPHNYKLGAVWQSGSQDHCRHGQADAVDADIYRNISRVMLLIKNSRLQIVYWDHTRIFLRFFHNQNISILMSVVCEMIAKVWSTFCLPFHVLSDICHTALWCLIDKLYVSTQNMTPPITEFHLNTGDLSAQQ